MSVCSTGCCHFLYEYSSSFVTYTVCCNHRRNVKFTTHSLCNPHSDDKTCIMQSHSTLTKQSHAMDHGRFIRWKFSNGLQFKLNIAARKYAHNHFSYAYCTHTIPMHSQWRPQATAPDLTEILSTHWLFLACVRQIFCGIRNNGKTFNFVLRLMRNENTGLSLMSLRWPKYNVEIGHLFQYNVKVTHNYQSMSAYIFNMHWPKRNGSQRGTFFFCIFIS